MTACFFIWVYFRRQILDQFPLIRNRKQSVEIYYAKNKLHRQARKGTQRHFEKQDFINTFHKMEFYSLKQFFFFSDTATLVVSEKTFFIITLRKI